MPKPEVDRITWTVPELAVALGVSERTAWSMLRDGQLEGVVRIGRRVLVLRQVVVDQLMRGAGLDPDTGAPPTGEAEAAEATEKANAEAVERRKAMAVANHDGWL
jgi:hypothetical protein